MLIKFTGGGRGGGRQVAEYLTRSEGRDHAPPEVVRGDMNRTRELIDSIDREWTYTHGVLSFAAEDAPTEEQQQKCMDMFERLAFAGLDREQYDITWVRHRHTASGRTELHFVSPRMELNSGKAMNIAPPHWEHTYAPLRDALNWEHGWARPDDPERALELQRSPERAQEGFRLREGREGIHEYLTGLVAAEAVTDRSSMVLALKEAGLEVTREGKDYVTVRDPESDERFRMKGRIYEKDWTYDRELDRAITQESSRANSREREDHRSRAREAHERYQQAIERRASFNSERYYRHELEDQHGLDRAEMGQSLLVDRADRDLGDLGRLIHLALDQRVQECHGPERSNELERLPDLHPRGAEIPDRAAGERGRDLHERGGSRGLHSTTEWGVSTDERSTDSLRARLIGAVRGFGERVRSLATSVQEHVRAASKYVQAAYVEDHEAREADRRARTAGSDRDQRLERADRANRSMAEELRELGAASERVAGRTQEMTREREVRERAVKERTRSRDYGWEL